MFAKHLAIVLLFSLLFVSCETEIPQAIESVSDEFCLENDCVTSKNDNIVYTGDLTKNSDNLNVVRKKFSRFWTNSQPVNTRNLYGKPAWNLLTIDELSESDISYYYLPMIHEHSDKVEAVVLITLLKNSYTFRFNLLKRGELLSLPLDIETEQIPRGYFETKIDATAATTFFLEAESKIFGLQDPELLSQLPPKARIPFSDNKDVICTIRTYVVTSCQTTVGGQNNEYYIGTDCSHSIETVTGCTGRSGGPTGGPTTGGGGSPGGGNGVVVTTTTDRCAEDGVGCEDEFPDCESWVFVPTYNPYTIACGISKLEWYYVYASFEGARLRAGTITGRFDEVVYFEFTANPFSISPGRAANLSAAGVEAATQAMRLRFGSDPGSNQVMKDAFMEYLNIALALYGGKATLTNNHGTTSVNPYQWGYIPHIDCD